MTVCGVCGVESWETLFLYLSVEQVITSPLAVCTLKVEVTVAASVHQLFQLVQKHRVFDDSSLTERSLWMLWAIIPNSSSHQSISQREDRSHSVCEEALVTHTHTQRCV